MEPRQLPAQSLARRVRLLVALSLVWAAGLAAPEQAQAHALDESYQLPLPLWLYLWGAFAAVAASFVVVLAADTRTVASGPPTGTALPLGFTRAGSILLKALGLVAWFGAMVSGLFGIIHEFFPATIFWILIWAGLPIVAALIGNPWPALSPFRTVYNFAARVTGRELDLGVPYPEAARRWPAVAVLLGFLIVELTVAGSDLGRSVGALLLGYTIFTFVGMVVFGPVAWLRNAEVLEVLLGWFGRLAPVGRRSVSRDLCAGCGEGCNPEECGDCPECSIVAEPGQQRLVIRPPLSGMAAVRQTGWSDAAFIVGALAGVTFDGLQETAFWLTVNNSLESALAALLPEALVYTATPPIGLIGTWLVFLGVFAVGAWITPRLGAITAPLDSTVGGWAASLLPIAAGYGIAHYGTLLLQGALTLPGMFAGFAAPEAELGWVPAGFVWYLSVVAIVGGHVAAVLLAHREAIRRGTTRPFLAELPLVALMLGYTVISLWIIAQPITIEAP